MSDKFEEPMAIATQVGVWNKNLFKLFSFVYDASREENRFKGRGWSWSSNSECKYISIRIDMRDGAFILLNRDGQRISFEQLQYQGQPNEAYPKLIPKYKIISTIGGVETVRASGMTQVDATIVKHSIGQRDDEELRVVPNEYVEQDGQ